MKDKKIFAFLLAGALLIFAGFVSKEISVVSKNKEESALKAFLFKDDSKTLGSNSNSIAEVFISKVLDGDTIETSSGARIRYIGINAPEKGEKFSSLATELNKELVLNKKIRLEFDVQAKDRYGRTLAYVFIDNIFVNQEMVKKGLAVTETIQPNVKYQNEIVNAQKEAREKCLGIWKALCDQSASKTSGSSLNNCIKIISIHADAPDNDNQNKNGEWVEIKNTCSELILLDKWVLKDSSSSNKYQFKNFSLGSEKLVLLYSGCGQDSSDKLYWQCPEGKYAIWNNAGDHAFLYNGKGELVSDYQY